MLICAVWDSLGQTFGGFFPPFWNKLLYRVPRVCSQGGAPMWGVAHCVLLTESSCYCFVSWLCHLPSSPLCVGQRCCSGQANPAITWPLSFQSVLFFHMLRWLIWLDFKLSLNGSAIPTGILCPSWHQCLAFQFPLWISSTHACDLPAVGHSTF